ncbi:phosphoglycolate phosphatase [Futiania mangrovi]|uniref:Phosphoglycolate phosphatase n=1 Tax=Futiania mangrovi TaxID=2959716 RepID=A0A9J6PID2_9PROT|nr:phosphoglycolate phosphatase [Futiania mangrovii]MCP1335842.1 phosphoglycolate phosphatase [Futiania mangrovii]
MSLPAGLPFSSIVFDLDGTLVDTAPDLAAALNHVLDHAGRRPVDLQEVRQLVGRGARVAIERGLTLTGAPEERPEILDDYFARFLAYYGDNICAGSRPFPNAVETVETFRAQGARTGICTNKPQVLTDGLMRALNLADRFEAIVGADSVPARKPDPGHLFETIRRMGGEPASAVLIGDSETDVKTARAAGIPVIAVSFGYTVTPAHALGADAVIDDFAELADALARLARSAA